jgi:hypothetical protein
MYIRWSLSLSNATCTQQIFAWSSGYWRQGHETSSSGPKLCGMHFLNPNRPILKLYRYGYRYRKEVCFSFQFLWSFVVSFMTPSVSETVMSNGKTVNGRWIGKVLEGIGHCIIAVCSDVLMEGDENYRIPQSKSKSGRHSNRVPPENKTRTLLLWVHQPVWSKLLVH